METVINLIESEELGAILRDESLANHTTMRVGGIAKYMYIPANLEALIRVIKVLKEEEVKYMTIGRGSNLIFRYDINDTLIIKLSQVMEEIEIETDEVIVGAGRSLQYLAKRMSKAGYQGLEFAGGIPSTVGGALFMNAGAHAGEMSDIVRWVEYINEDDEVIRLTNEECKFSYRHSIFQELHNPIIIRAGLKIILGDKAEVFKRMSGNLEYRKEMQPLDLPSCGSVFRNPPGNHAGKLVEECGLKGYVLGGAKVSEKHANFIVNYDNATAEDIVNLIEHVKAVVYEKTLIKLHTEIRILEHE